MDKYKKRLGMMQTYYKVNIYRIMMMVNLKNNVIMKIIKNKVNI